MGLRYARPATTARTLVGARRVGLLSPTLDYASSIARAGCEGNGNVPLDGPPPLRGDGPRASEGRPRCRHCNDVLGVYEPIILLINGEPPRLTSQAATPLPPNGVAFHQDCFLGADTPET